MNSKFPFLAHGGDLGILIDRYPWGNTTLGPIFEWPQSLKTVVSLVLRSNVPMVTLWGPDGIMIYNDSYAGFAGKRHPSLLGSKVREGWPEVADFNDHVMRVVLEGKTLAYKDQQLTLLRSGTPEPVWMNLDYSPVLGESGEVTGVIAIVVETTKQVEAERRFRSEQARLAQMFEQAPSFMVLLEGPGHKFVLANTAFKRFIGLDEVVGFTVAALVPEANTQGFVTLLDQVFESGRAYTAFGARFDLQARGGRPAEQRFVDFVFQPISDNSGNVTGVFVEGVDVTQRTTTEELFRVAQEGARVGAFEWFPETGRLLVSDEYRRIWGLPADLEVTDALLSSLVLPGDLDQIGPSRLSREANPLQHAEYRIRRPDTGEVRWLARRGEVLRRNAEAPPRYVGVTFDVTETRKTADALRDTQIRLRLALDAAAIGVWDYNLASGELSWDLRIREVAEVAADAPVTLETDFLGAVHPDDRERVAQAFNDVSQSDEPSNLALDFRVVGRRTGKVTWSALQGARVVDQGEPRVIGTARDITSEREANEKLLELNQTLERRVAEAIAERHTWADMLEGTDDPVAAVDVNLKFLAMNKAYTDACERLFGVRFIVGDSLIDGLEHLPETRDAAVDLWRRALAGEAIDIADSGGGGPEDEYFDLKFRPLRNRDGVQIGAFQFSRDVTERVRAQRKLSEAEAALRQSHKMEAVGQLTGGIAHDFNNMLAVVLGSLDLLTRRIDVDDGRIRRYADAATDAAKRAAALTQRLLAFSRQQPLNPEPVNPNKLVAGMSELLSHALGGAVRLETVLAAGIWRTNVDPNQLENVVLNLAVNARDAMPDGGRLTIETQNVHFDERYSADNPDVTAGQYIMIAVTDTGLGMAADVISKAFDPFFTTKEVGKGTGLGLSQVYGFAKQSGGNVKIYSEVGQGTAVKLYLRRHFGADIGLVAKTTGPEMPMGEEHELVLVVEDEPAVRQLSVDALTSLGYRVLEADGAEAALRVLDTRPDIALLFTDVVMPEMNGKRLADEARKKHPNLKVLFTTGFTRNAVVHNGVLDEGVQMLGKPFTIDALALKIRAILDASSSD